MQVLRQHQNRFTSFLPFYLNKTHFDDISVAAAAKVCSWPLYSLQFCNLKGTHHFINHTIRWKYESFFICALHLHYWKVFFRINIGTQNSLLCTIHRPHPNYKYEMCIYFRMGPCRCNFWVTQCISSYFTTIFWPKIVLENVSFECSFMCPLLFQFFGTSET